MERIHKGNGFAVIERNGEYQITFPKGITGEPAFFPITKELMEKAFKSSDDAYEVMIYAETGLWPKKKTEEEENERVREFIRQFPELLIKVPDNQDLFTKRELDELLPLAKKEIAESEENE
ncbi:hypothetical protein CYV26_11705 [Carnobacterium maltaromaticum]|uniref:hypothetical protein n=1 Tax=Carnobacterium maltaromaticum TaxID=2751 RepID=UPI000C76E3F7|nr:hypothetical protein [Carnobacterium maltaromaticum]PLS33771.1 hypothetical protein CYV33_11690 [Carnobacterium maltaromaticum]PLS35753.1 hypothetical protein CYV30_08515 [Carnobacterium maltaromaticum]PLS36202.1 hypothetical protein CYV31_08520 [Carnobacterium maltaromaticum]PLS42659.1 hypothetical protein CYV27_11690 [Carnobacterium maltaromaticum]PLS42894.1 hypothetical protein CYV28_08530 [Carnobacterium maltaromaticum]